MKWILVAAVALSGSAFAGDACLANCAETVKECQNVCKKTLKKEAPDKIPFCQDKCKEFESECKKDCADEAGKK